ncbi:hypothetical protein D3C86_791800 [compost metagenome]
MKRTLSLCLSAIALRCGKEAIHPPHQVAQKSTTYTFPFSKFLTGLPLSQVSTIIGGAGSPILSVGT